MRNIFIIILMLASGFLYSQVPLLPSTKVVITNVTVFTDPYTVVGQVQDMTSNWTASDIQEGDSLYMADGSELRVYAVTNIVSAVGPNFTIQIDDTNNTGNIPPADEGVLYRATANFKLNGFVGGIAETLQTMVDNRNMQKIDAALGNTIIHGTYKDDKEAASNGVPLGGLYQVAWGSLSSPAGTLRRRLL